MHGSSFMALELKSGMQKEKRMNTRPDPNDFPNGVFRMSTKFCSTSVASRTRDRAMSLGL